MEPKPSLTELLSVEANGVTCIGPHLESYAKLGVAFECDDVASIMRLGAAIATSKTLASLLDCRLMMWEKDSIFVVLFYYKLLELDGPKEAVSRIRDLESVVYFR